MRAIRDYQGPLKEHEVTIFVRRGGPNYQEGLRVMGEVGKMGTFSLPPTPRVTTCFLGSPSTCSCLHFLLSGVDRS